MSLYSILIKVVGGGIAKGVLNIWLKEDLFPTKVGENFIDFFLNKKTDDAFAISNAEIQFQQISKNVAKNLKQLFDNTGNLISDKKKEEVAYAAGRVLFETHISFKELTGNNFDPDFLYQKFLLGPKGWVNPTVLQDGQEIFNETQSYLYKRTLNEASQYIIDIAAQLPSTQGKILAEILTRESILTQKADEILEEVRRINAQTNESDNLAIQFENDYRRAVTRELDELVLFGVDLSDSSKRYRLSIAYVTLSVEYKTSEDDEVEETNLLPIDQVFSQTNRLFIRGAAGSGKTTLMKWAAVMSASKVLTGDLESWNESIPFFIKLREFSDKDLPQPEEFPSYISKALAGDKPEKWVREKLKEGKGILLIDGLDELKEDQRKQLKKWLKDLISVFPDSKYIITSRPYATEKIWFEDHDFLVADLQDMNGQDVNEFIEHWHASVLDGLTEEKDQEELKKLETNLKSVVKSNRNIRKLATNPLLCAMICALHRDRASQLPTDRIELYRACIEMFLRRDQEKKVTLIDYIEIGSRQKNVLLEDLAYWLIRNSWSEVEVEKVDNRFQLKIDALKDINEATTGKGARQYFVERSGILRQPSVGKIDFPHRTFEEFLAAKAVVDESDFGVLVVNASKVQWREVIILACGMASRKDRERLILDLIRRGDDLKKGRPQLHLLAAACSEVVIDLSDMAREEIQKRLVKLIPPKNIEAAKELSKAGELVVPYIKVKREMDLNKALPIIRTLVLIGGEGALSKLENFVIDERVGIMKALLTSIKYFDLKELYMKRILKCLKFKNLKINDQLSPDSIKALEKNKYLTKLRFDLFNKELHFNLLKSLPNLKALEINQIFSPNIYCICELTSLKILSINRLVYLNYPTTYSSLNNLTHLDIKPNYKNSIVDFYILRNYKKLKTLKINKFKVINLQEIKNLTSLEIFEVDVNNFFNSRTTLDNLDLPHRLTRLNLVGCFNLSNAELKIISNQLSGLRKKYPDIYINRLP